MVLVSWSFQIQLEKIRASENEVRWQHEEDVDDCSNCKQTFSVTRRKVCHPRLLLSLPHVGGVLFSLQFVCLSVCLSVCYLDNSKGYRWIFTKSME